MGECPYCGDPADPVEGHCWTCGMRRSWPVPIWEGEPPQDQMWTDQEYVATLEEPVL
jgi:hypothetical protein